LAILEFQPKAYPGFLVCFSVIKDVLFAMIIDAWSLKLRVFRECQFITAIPSRILKFNHLISRIKKIPFTVVLKGI